MDDKLTSAIASIVQYNGLEGSLKDIRSELDRQREDYLTLKDIELNRDLMMYTSSRLELYNIAQAHFIYMLLVLLYGNYGTSPRFGWIEDKEGAAAFIDKLLND